MVFFPISVHGQVGVERKGEAVFFGSELDMFGLLYSSKESKFVRTKPRPEPT